MGKVIRRGRKHCSLAGYISCPIPLPTGHPPSPTHTHQLKESSWAFGNNNTQNRNFHRFHKSLQIFKRRNNRVLLIASSLSWNTEWSRAKANRILPRECTGHSKHLLPTTLDSTHGHHQMANRNQTDYILCSQRWRSSLQSAKTRLGADCGSDHELLIAKFRLKLKKVGETTRPLRYDLNQIPYDYTVEVRNRFKGLDLIECLKNYGMRFVTLYRRQGSRPSPWKRNAKKQNGCLGRPYK